MEVRQFVLHSYVIRVVQLSKFQPYIYMCFADLYHFASAFFHCIFRDDGFVEELDYNEEMDNLDVHPSEKVVDGIGISVTFLDVLRS